MDASDSEWKNNSDDHYFFQHISSVPSCSSMLRAQERYTGACGCENFKPVRMVNFITSLHPINLPCLFSLHPFLIFASFSIRFQYSRCLDSCLNYLAKRSFPFWTLFRAESLSWPSRPCMSRSDRSCYGTSVDKRCRVLACSHDALRSEQVHESPQSFLVQVLL